jgi:hypothetical protein
LFAFIVKIISSFYDLESPFTPLECLWLFSFRGSLT